MKVSNKNPYVTNNNKIKKFENNSNSIDFFRNSEISNTESSAIKINISLNAQIMLINYETKEESKSNSLAQSSIENLDNLKNITKNSEILDFLSGKTLQNGFSLNDMGYEGKALTEITSNEAKELISEDGFFGVKKTSQRVTNFTINLANNNIELLKEAREGIIKGFKDAQKIWDNELPAISYETQKETLKLIDSKITQLENSKSQDSLNIS